MFAEPETNSPWGRRAAVMAGLGLVLASVILIALTATSRTAARHAGSPATPTAAAAAAGLELLSMRDSRQPGSLIITGLVQNPRSGTSLSRVTVRTTSSGSWTPGES